MGKNINNETLQSFINLNKGDPSRQWQLAGLACETNMFDFGPSS